MDTDAVLNKIYKLNDDARENLILKTTVADTVKKILSTVEDPNIKLQVNKVWTVDKYDNEDIKSQLLVRNRKQSWADEIRADLSLIDKTTGKEIDRAQNIKVSNVPKITPRATFLVGGNEYQFTKQARLRPGVYTRIQDNGEISTFFNVDKSIDFDRGFNNNFKINFDPEKKVFTMGYGAKNIPLINVLNSVGVKADEMKTMWGKDVYESNVNAYGHKDIVNQKKMYEAIFGKQPPASETSETIANAIKERLFATELDKETTKITLGKAYDKVDKGSLLTASKKILDVHRGEVEPDDRDSIIFKSFYGAEDHIREKLIKNAERLKSSIKFRLSKTRSINKSLSSQTFDPFVLGTITTSQLSNPPGQTNLLSIIGENSKITVMGEGGIGSTNQISDDSRQISNSEAGFIDPLHTPEGGQIGVSVHHTMRAIKLGNDLYSQFYDKSGKLKFMKPMDLHGKTIAFPDEYNISKDKITPKDDSIRAIKDGKITTVSAKEVDFIIRDHTGMFDTSTNLIPFLDSLQGNRGLTAAKMKEQALPLKYRDKPLWRIVDASGNNLNKNLGSAVAIPKAPSDGIISKITDDEIVVIEPSGTKHTVQVYNNFPLNAESFIHSEPKVKVGDRVKRGDVLADNNNTRDGEFAIGANLRVAYIPWKGYNYEDSTIISESAAKKLTSEHLYGFSAKRSSKGLFSRDKFKAYYPEEINTKKLSKLDKDGVIKVGESVDHGDILIAHMEKRAPTADDLALGRLDKQLKKDFANNSVKWDKDHKGIVTSIEKHGNSVTVNIKTEEQLKVADKISGLHGNKHIVSKILPDHEMPVTEDGKIIDITMNPIGVSNRINTSQLLEAAAGKLAEKTGEQYEIQNFKDVDNTGKLIADLKKAGVEEKEYIIDPVSGKKTKNKVMTGLAHILKLEHKIDHKFSARYREGYDSNEQPLSGGETGGKNIGRMELGAMLARGAKENLKEMFNIKGQRNDEFWKALEMGHMLPPPKTPHVWKKMEAMMKGAGINVEQEGKTFTVKPMTDKHILTLSAGELSDPTLTYRKKDLAPMKNGLFDPVKAGGMMGDNYTHFKLPEPVLNPIMAKAAATILGMPESHLEDVIVGKKFIDKSGAVVSKPDETTESGSVAIQKMLRKVDVDAEMKAAIKKAETVKNPTELNKLNRKIRYLKNLKHLDMRPEEYVINNVLVVPPKFRPMFTMGTEGTVIMSDANDLYQQVAMTAETMKDLKATVKDVAGSSKPLENALMGQVRGAIYNDMKALAGLREPTAYLHRVKDKKGFVMQIDGGKKQTKEGFYQDKVISRRQDLVGRSTIMLNPELGGDQIGIPKEMANKIFQPFIVKEIVGLGYTPLEAQKHIKEETDVFKKARQLVADKRLVIANRAPTLHRWNMTAFRPSLTDGKAIEVPSVVMSKFMGADVDGDSLIVNVFISININKLQEYLKINKIPKKDLVFGSDIDYINLEDFIQERKIVMPANAKLPVRAGEDVVHINMQDLPRIESTKRVTGKGTICYDVPEGISIYTTDKTGKNLDLYPVTEFSIHPNLDNLIVEFKNGDEMFVSDDHSLVAMDMDIGELKEIKPEDAIGKAIPKATRIDIVPSITEIKLKNYSTNGKAVATKESVPADERLGYVIGLIVGDGWIDATARGVYLANIDDNVGNEFSNIINSMLVKDIGTDIQDNHHDFEGYDCYSKKFTKSTVALAQNFIPWVGQGARNKHLPPFFMSTSEEFRLGLLAGLIDTDGTVSWAHAKVKKNKQLMCAYSTMSERLADEVVTLCRTLGIKATITTTTKGEYHIGISSVGLHDAKLNLRHTHKKDTLNEFQSTPYTESQIKSGIAAHDVVPFSEQFFNIAKKEFKCRKENGMYCAIHNGKHTGLLSRYSAKKILSRMPDAFPKWWIDVVNNEDITWTTVRECRRNHNRVTMYDITVPGPYTFMTACGIIVQDTFQIHTPIGQKALDEAEHMLASNDLLKTGYGTTLAAPDMDSTVGMWLAAKGKGGENKGKFSSIEEAREAHKNNKIEYSDTVEIGGTKAPFAVHEANSVLPDDVKKYNVEMKKSTVNKWIEEVTNKHGGKIALQLADKIKEIGNEYSTLYGFTIGISDTEAAKEVRDPIIAPLKNKKSFDTKYMIDVVNNQMGKQIQDALVKKYDEDTMIGVAIHSEGGKGIGNTSQIISAPLVMQDANKKVIPMPVTRSYSEGLKVGDYWAAAHGARSGNIQKSVASYKPGWLTADLINSIYTTRVYGEDPVDTEGVEEEVSDTKNILNRYTAREIKDSKGRIIAKRNELINSDVIAKMNMSGVKTVYVQSPLTDPTPGDGISSWSYGVDYKGNRYKTGDNIGIISAHTITEPSLNMAMKAFHTGGAFSKSGTAFDVLDRLMRFGKNIPDKATVSEVDGTISSIKPSSIGGYDVTVKDEDGNEHKHYVITGNELKAKMGEKVKRGDVMSGGTVSVHDVMKTKGIKDAQKFLVKEIGNINENKLDKREIEVLVRGITNTTRIKKSYGSPYVPGDVAPLTTVESLNKNRTREVDTEDAEGAVLNKDYSIFKKGSLVTDTLIRHLQDRGIKRIEVETPEIMHEPFLSSQGIGSKASTSEDWIARMSSNRLAGMMQEAVGQGWHSAAGSNIGSPLPSLATGVN